MTKTKKITLAATRDIPFNKLVLSQSNVRMIRNGESIAQLAGDIAQRGLLQSLSVRPIIGADGEETGMYEVPAGGRRYRALELLVEQKRLAKTAPVPCIVKEDGIAEEDSLAENTQREALHPVDQFRAFKALIDKGLSEDEIAARFFVTPAVVKQRLRLAAVSENLIEAYVADEMKLEQLMAFTLTPDHARQEQVWETVNQGWNREPYYIRRLLTEGAVGASDRRALFVGLEAYTQAGGVITRDLFQDDEGGWLEDAALLDKLAVEKLKTEAEKIAAEGWKWIAASIDFPYGHKQGLRRLAGQSIGMTEEEESARAAVVEEFDRLQAEYEDADELPDEVDERFGELEEMIERFDNRPVQHHAANIARAGVFISVDGNGELQIERGYVKPEDEAPAAPESDGGTECGVANEGAGESGPRIAVITIGGEDPDSDDEPEQGLKPLSDRLVAELTAHRTLALRDAVGQAPDAAFLSVLHALCMTAFYRFSSNENCMEISAKSESFTAYGQTLNDSAPARAVQRRHEDWQARLPEKPAALWDALTALDAESRAALFAHCASLTVNIAREPWSRRPDALVHGEQLAKAVNLDMVAAGWKPTVDNYLGRVPKARILEAVREGRDERSAQLIDHLKKGEMAKEAERLLDGAGWLPEPLRPAAPDAGEADSGKAGETADLPEFLAGDDDAENCADAEDEELPAAAE